MKNILIILITVFLSSNIIAQNAISTKIASFSGWVGYTKDGVNLPGSITSNDNNYHIFTLLGTDFAPQRVFVMPDMDQTGYLAESKLLVATQTLFNDDDKLEFIDIKNSNDGQRMFVVNEEGAELGEIPYVCTTPLEEWQIPTRIFATNVINYGGKIYLYLVCDNETVFYSITKATAGKPAVFSKSVSLNITPNPAKQGETIRFSLPEGEINKLDVYDINGTYRFGVVSQQNVEIEASSLQQGVNVIRAVDSDNNEFVGKVIVH